MTAIYFKITRQPIKVVENNEQEMSIPSSAQLLMNGVFETHRLLNIAACVVVIIITHACNL